MDEKLCVRQTLLTHQGIEWFARREVAVVVNIFVGHVYGSFFLVRFSTIEKRIYHYTQHQQKRQCFRETTRLAALIISAAVNP